MTVKIYALSVGDGCVCRVGLGGGGGRGVGREVS